MDEFDGNFTLWNEGGVIELSHNKVRGPEFAPIHFRIDKLSSPDILDKLLVKKADVHEGKWMLIFRLCFPVLPTFLAFISARESRFGLRASRRILQPPGSAESSLRAGESDAIPPQAGPESPRSGPLTGPNQKQGGPIRPPRRRAALQGDRGAFELHWTAGGRPLAVRGAVGVQRGRNDVARASRCASRCDWLHDLGSRRCKPLMPERNEPVIVTVRAFNNLSKRWCRKSKQNGGQSNLRLSHGFSLPLFEVIGFTPFV